MELCTEIIAMYYPEGVQMEFIMGMLMRHFRNVIETPYYRCV